jgi:hypothetical protein
VPAVVLFGLVWRSEVQSKYQVMKMKTWVMERLFAQSLETAKSDWCRVWPSFYLHRQSIVLRAFASIDHRAP